MHKKNQIKGIVKYVICCSSILCACMVQANADNLPIIFSKVLIESSESVLLEGGIVDEEIEIESLSINGKDVRVGWDDTFVTRYQFSDGRLLVFELIDESGQSTSVQMEFTIDQQIQDQYSFSSEEGIKSFNGFMNDFVQSNLDLVNKVILKIFNIDLDFVFGHFRVKVDDVEVGKPTIEMALLKANKTSEEGVVFATTTLPKVRILGRQAISLCLFQKCKSLYDVVMEINADHMQLLSLVELNSVKKEPNKMQVNVTPNIVNLSIILSDMPKWLFKPVAWLVEFVVEGPVIESVSDYVTVKAMGFIRIIPEKIYRTFIRNVLNIEESFDFEGED